MARITSSDGLSASRSGGGGGITRDTRSSSEAGSPMKKSASRGPATSSANQVPMDTPVIRFTTSPIR